MPVVLAQLELWHILPRLKLQSLQSGGCHNSDYTVFSTIPFVLKTSTLVAKIRLRKRTNIGYFPLHIPQWSCSNSCASSMPHSVTSWLLRRSLQKSYLGSDQMPVVLAQLELWHILPRIRKVCNLVAATIQTFLHYTVCDPLVKPTMPPSFRYWTCIKQEPGTENFNTCRKNASPKADQHWLVSLHIPQWSCSNSCASSMPHSVISWLLKELSKSRNLGSDQMPVVLAQLELWHILPRIRKVCNLVAATIQTFLHYTVCDPLVKPTMPPSFRHWTCIKQEPGIENFNTCRKNASPKADPHWLFSFTYPSMVLFQQLCLFHATLCDFLIVEKNSPKVVIWIWPNACCVGSTWTLAPLAEALQSLQSGGCHNSDISPLYRLWPASQAYNASIIQALDLHQSTSWHLTTHTLHICRKKPAVDGSNEYHHFSKGERNPLKISKKGVCHESMQCEEWIILFLLVTSDVYGILLTHVGAYLTKGQASKWTPQ